MAKLAEKWKTSPTWKKFILVNLVIPWTPIIMLSISYFAPPEVVDMVNQNGKLVGSVAGESWKIASFFFAKFVGF